MNNAKFIYLPDVRALISLFRVPHTLMLTSPVEFFVRDICLNISADEKPVAGVIA